MGSNRRNKRGRPIRPAHNERGSTRRAARQRGIARIGLAVALLGLPPAGASIYVAAATNDAAHENSAAARDTRLAGEANRRAASDNRAAAEASRENARLNREAAADALRTARVNRETARINARAAREARKRVAR